MAQLIPCPVCGAALQQLAARPHITWHLATHSLNGWEPDDALGRLVFLFDAPAADDDPGAATAKLPPIRETVLRRPPPPEVRELKGPELLRALADQIAVELAEDEDQDEDDEDDPRPCVKCGHRADVHLTHPFPGTTRRCTNPACTCTGFLLS